MNRHEWPSPQELREAEEGEAEVWQRLASRLKVNTKSGGVWDRIVLEQAYYDEIGQHVDIETIVAKYQESHRRQRNQALARGRRNRGDASRTAVLGTWHELYGMLAGPPRLDQVAAQVGIQTKGGQKRLHRDTVRRILNELGLQAL